MLIAAFLLNSLSCDAVDLWPDAIQKAIDAAALEEGSVVIPKGIFLSGALYFKTGPGLRLKIVQS